MVSKGADMSIRTPPPAASSLASPRGRRELAWAWVSVAVMVVLLVGTFASSSSEILGPITVLVALIAVWLGLSARRHGEVRGLVPGAVGAVVSGFFLVMITLSLVLHFGLGWE